MKQNHVCARSAPYLLAWCLLTGCSPGGPAPQPAPQPAVTDGNPLAAQPAEREPPPGPLQFADVAQTLDLQFHHHSPLTAQRHIHLFLGSGIGWFDMDRDGWPDLYCCQGASFSPDDPAGNRAPDQPTNALFHNHEGSALVDVTRQAGLTNVDYSMAIAAADYNNDGFVDLCVTGYGRILLYRNNGDGCFTPMPLPLADSPGRLSASCAWADIDADGNLDLFVTNYAQLGPDDYPTCEHTSAGTTIPISCHPAQLDARHDLLYRNTGDGQFVEVSREAGLAQGQPRAGLGVIAADLDTDGDIDFYVANDTTENSLWENQGAGQFQDRGAAAGTSRNRHGANEAGMGLAAGDITGRGRIDLFVTNYYAETNTLYRNEGSQLFADVTDEMGLGAPSRLRLGFGTSLSDFDNDGWLDLLIANGHVQDRLADVQRPEPFAQRPLLFHNQGGVRFAEVTAGAGPFLRTPHVGRSTAIADVDRDGDPDVAINCLNEAAALLQNNSPNSGNWLRIELIGRASNRAGIGALVRVDVGDRSILRPVHAGTGYLSSDESTILIGLGRNDAAVDPAADVTVTWPGGQRESWSSLAVNQSWQLFQGSGKPPDATP